MLPRVCNWGWKRAFTSSARRPGRAIIYKSSGEPEDVLQVLTYGPLSPPGRQELKLKFLLAPINPADINTIQGVYPSRPELSYLSPDNGVFVGGNEGLARVVEVGQDVIGIAPDDLVVMRRPQLGTWTSSRICSMEDVFRLPNTQGLTETQMAGLTVNPSTAFNMLHDFVSLKEGDWIIQNGANSAVGEAVIQIAAAKGFKTINFIRDRVGVDELMLKLIQMGATHVFVYDALEDKTFRKKVKEITGNQDIRLCLNCVGGPQTTRMLSLLGNNAHLVTYGGMSKQPLSIPTSSLIFKDLTAHGFWQSRWHANRSPDERSRLLDTLTTMMRDGKLKEPQHQIVEVGGALTDAEATRQVRELFAKLKEGKRGYKTFLSMG